MPSPLRRNPTRRRLPPAAAFGLLLSIVIVFLAGSSAPTPLYAIYQAEWGFTPITETIVFGIYAIAVLTALLTVGSLSDHIGRRPVLLVAIVMQIVGMLVFATATGVPELLAARVVQGLSTGAAVSALGAGLLDLDRAKGPIANAVGPVSGNAAGALGAALLVQFLPDPTHLVYLVLIAILVVQFAGVLAIAETTKRQPGALASLKPRIGVSQAARGPLLVAIPILVAIWALGGYYGSLAPSLARLVTGSDALLVGGLPAFALSATAAVSTMLTRKRAPRTVMLTGACALLGGVALVLLSIEVTSTALFFLGTAIAGIGFGGGFQGAMRTILPLVKPAERSGVLSVVFLVSYISLGLPAVLGGWLAVHSGVLTASREYGAGVIVLGALTLLGMLARGRGSARATSAIGLRPT
jgi:MFS family permease